MIFTFVPTQGTTADYKPKLHVTPFGNGYAQRAPEGLNNMPKSWSLSFDNLDDYTKEQLRTFLKQVVPAQTPFTWKDMDGETLIYICTDFSISFTEEDDSSIRCKFEQFFG